MCEGEKLSRTRQQIISISFDVVYCTNFVHGLLKNKNQRIQKKEAIGSPH